MKIKALFTISLILLLGSCNDNKKKENDLSQVTVGYLNMVSSLTHFVALENGYYTENNLEVKGNVIKTSNRIAQELGAGHIDVGIELSITPTLKLLEQSPNSIKIFSTSNITQNNGFDAILVKSKSNIKDLEGLAGKKVGGFPGSTAKVSFLELFKRMHPNLEEPKFISLAPNLHIQSLQTGEIDALFAYEPVLSTGVIKFNFKKIFPSVYGSQFSPNPIGVGAVNTMWMSENPNVANSFLKAIDKAVEFIGKNPNKAKEILAKETNIDLEIALNMNTLPLSKSTEIDLQNLQEYLQLLEQMNEIDNVPQAKSICIEQ